MKLNQKDLLIKHLKKSTIYVGDCWIFTGSTASTGYRRIMVDYKYIMVHRLSAHIFLGLDLSDSKQQANHKKECNSKSCWNPEHIYVGTQQENAKDEMTGYCDKGHLMTRMPGGRFKCKPCDAIRSRIYRARHKERH